MLDVKKITAAAEAVNIAQKRVEETYRALQSAQIAADNAKGELSKAQAEYNVACAGE